MISVLNADFATTYYVYGIDINKSRNAAGLLNCDIISYMLSIANWPLRRT